MRYDESGLTNTITPLRAKRTALRTVLDSAFDAVVSIDLRGRITLWNDKAEQMFGWRREEVFGVELIGVIVPEAMTDSYEDQLRSCRDNDSTPNNGDPIELELQDRHGACFPVEVSVNPIRIEQEAAGFTLFIRDLRPARERQHKLEVSDERLQRVLDGAEQGFWDIYPAGEGTALSSRCSTMLGYESGEIANGPPDSAEELHPDDYEDVHTAWLACQQPESTGLEVVYRMRAADGNWRWISDVGEVIARNATGHATRIVGTRTDVTDRLALEESLLASQKLECLGSVASGFAHDLNNILAAISGHATLAADVNEVPPKLAESLGVIQLAVTRARLLTENMLALGRPGEVTASEVGIRDCIESTCALLRPSLPRSIKVIVESDLPSSARINVDVGQFQQSIINLLLNARDAIEEEGRIHVSVKPSQRKSMPSALITVSDDGAGISVEDQEHIFKPFFTTKKPGEGTGIGLAVVAGFVNSSEGKLTVESMKGKGTEFRMELPLSTPVEAMDFPRDPASASGVRKVLLVEDHAMLRPMLAEAISAGGHDVVSFEGVSDVLESTFVREGGMDVCVIDVNLGDGNGVDLAAEIEARLGRSVPTVFSTGNPDSVAVCDLKPWQTLLRKPFEIDSLLRMIRRVSAGVKRQ